MVLHATRIVKRKGIEFALQICQKLQQDLPVFCADLSKLKLQLLSLGSKYADKNGIKTIPLQKIKEVAKSTWETLLSKEIYQTTVDYNYQIAQNTFY